MTGSAPRAVLLLTIGAAVTMLLGATAALAAPAPVPGCTWQRHSRTVIKHLRRHGQPRRVKRIKHWWACEAQPSLIQPQPALPVAPPPKTPPAEPEPKIGHLAVKAVEYVYTLSRAEASAGEVIVELNNQGEDAHNLNLQLANGQGPEYSVPEAGAQKRQEDRFTLPAGNYRLWCSLEGHEELGMKATLTVAP